MKTISIIIPVYNVEKYLRECLDSVLVSNKFTGQVVCVNDGSTDGSGNILEEYAKMYPNIEIITQKNAGLSAARNAGFDRATGEYILFLDSDDWLFPNVINKLQNSIDGEDVLYYNVKKYNESKQKLDADCSIAELKHLSGQAYFAAVYDKERNMPCVCVWSGVYSRNFLKENNLYNKPGILHEDELFTPQVLLKATNVSSVNEYVYVYRNRDGSIMTTVSMKHLADKLYVFHSLYDLFQQTGGIDISFYNHLSSGYLTLLLETYENGLSLRKLWTKKDSRRFIAMAPTDYRKRVAKLTYISPRLAYRYHMNKLSPLLRRMINKFL